MVLLFESCEIKIYKIIGFMKMINVCRLVSGFWFILLFCFGSFYFVRVRMEIFLCKGGEYLYCL